MNRARDRLLQLCFEDDNDEDDMIIFAVHCSRWIRERVDEFDNLRFYNEVQTPNHQFCLFWRK